MIESGCLCSSSHNEVERLYYLKIKFPREGRFTELMIE